MKLMITGSGGQLGSEFRALESVYPEHRFTFYRRQDLDVASEEQVDAAMKACGCDAVLNCAAFTSVDRAETDPAAAYRVNRDGAGVLARCAEKHGALLIHFSTYYVFDGLSPMPYREADPPSPMGNYGVSKLAGEELVRRSKASHLIIRTGWLYSRFGENFVKTMLRLGGERSRVDVVSDRVGSPTHAAELAKAVMSILDKSDLRQRYAATYHYGNEGACTWYDLAVAVMEQASLPCDVSPVDSTAFAVAGPRPWYSVMSSHAIKADWGITISHWQSALRQMIELQEGHAS